jgi:hypothetical protein
VNSTQGRNKLRRIEDLANLVAKDYSLVHLVPRGTPVFVDQNLRGRVRFSKRQGNFLPIIATENSSSVASAVASPANKLKVSRVIKGFEVSGAVLSIGPGRELVRIADIDPTTGDVVIEGELIASHSAGTSVHLFGVPVEVIGNYSTGKNVIQIRSAEPVMSGDQIAIETAVGLINSTVSTRIVRTTFLGLTNDGRSNYEIVLTEGVSRDLANEDLIILRAQPGYQSEKMRLHVNGPFVVDYVSGPFFDGLQIDEYLNIQLFNTLGQPVAGYEQPVSVGKNFAVQGVSIRSDSMLFWDVLRGSIQYRNGKFIAVTDAAGKFALSKELVPEFTPGTEWTVSVRSNNPAALRVGFMPNGYRDFSLITNIRQRVVVGTETTEQNANRIEVVVTTQMPFKEVEFDNWHPTPSSVVSMVYQITSTAYGNSVWQAGSLMLKPQFFTLDDITARYDFSAYDNGVIHL